MKRSQVEFLSGLVVVLCACGVTTWVGANTRELATPAAVAVVDGCELTGSVVAKDDGVYMPVYGIPALDAAARAVFEGQGWSVLPVDVKDVYRHTGSLRCLVGIIERRG